MMVDWLTVELPDPVGLPVNDGHVMRVKRSGQVDWTTPARLGVEGSWSSNMTFRAVGADYADDDDDGRALWELRAASGGNVRQSGLEVSGNPAKFLHGHNLFGSADPGELLGAVMDRALPSIWPHLGELPALDLANATLGRIDLTGSWLLDRAEDVVPFLRAMEESVWCPYRGKGVMNHVGTLYYGFTKKGERAKDWQLKLYSKGLDVTAHPLPSPAYSVPGLLDEVNRTVRVELTLRKAELKRLGLTKVGDWTPAKVGEIWRHYVAKLEREKAAVNLDAVDLAQLGLKPRHVAFLAAWKNGTDLRDCMPGRTFRRLRSELRDATGHDIALRCPKSNVVPLRRLVVASDAADRPQWADALTAVLSRAA